MKRWLVIETSGRQGQVGLVYGGEVGGRVVLDPARRHARDLAPAVAQLLDESGLSLGDLTGVMVSIGPGSFTGLRVGVMSAKMAAYAAGCRLRAVETFAAIAEQAPPEAERLWVIGDALRGELHAQRYVRREGVWHPDTPLAVVPRPQWLAQLAGEWISGPAVPLVTSELPAGCRVVPAESQSPTVAGVYTAGCRRPDLGHEELFALEPLYVRPSYAEEVRSRAPDRS